MTEPTEAKITRLLPEHQAHVVYQDGNEEDVSLEMCGCASLGDVVLVRNGFVLYKLKDYFESQQ